MFHTVHLHMVKMFSQLRLTRFLIPGGKGRFTVDSETGEILIVGREPFDCLTLEPFVLAVSAQGLGVPESINTPVQTVTVYCDDINPQFYGYPYTLEILEATPVDDV